MFGKKMEHSLRYQKCGNEQFNSESLSESLFFTNSHNYGNRQSYYPESLVFNKESQLRKHGNVLILTNLISVLTASLLVFA